MTNAIICNDCNSSEIMMELWNQIDENTREFRVCDSTPGSAFCLKCNDYILYNYTVVGGCFL